MLVLLVITLRFSMLGKGNVFVYLTLQRKYEQHVLSSQYILVRPTVMVKCLRKNNAKNIFHTNWKHFKCLYYTYLKVCATQHTRFYTIQYDVMSSYKAWWNKCIIHQMLKVDSLKQIFFLWSEIFFVSRLFKWWHVDVIDV